VEPSINFLSNVIKKEKDMNLNTLLICAVAAFSGFSSVAGACSIAPPNEDLIREKLQTVASTYLEMNELNLNIIVEPRMVFDTQYISSTGMCPDQIIYSEAFAVRYTVNDAFGAATKTVCNGVLKVSYVSDWTEASVDSFKVEGRDNMRCTR
jgi:hypothetical protein